MNQSTHSISDNLNHWVLHDSFDRRAFTHHSFHTWNRIIVHWIHNVPSSVFIRGHYYSHICLIHWDICLAFMRWMALSFCGSYAPVSLNNGNWTTGNFSGVVTEVDSSPASITFNESHPMDNTTPPFNPIDHTINRSNNGITLNQSSDVSNVNHYWVQYLWLISITYHGCDRGRNHFTSQ